jgi:hypothetical protein
MKMENDKYPIRKRNRLKDYDYSSNGAYFITICTKDRKNIFEDKEQPAFVGEDILPYKYFDGGWTDEARCIKEDWREKNIMEDCKWYMI